MLSISVMIGVVGLSILSILKDPRGTLMGLSWEIKEPMSPQEEKELERMKYNPETDSYTW